MKNLKVSFNRTMDFMRDDYISHKNFNELSGSLFYVDDFFSRLDKNTTYSYLTAIQFILNENTNKSTGEYIAKPVCIYIDEFENVISVVDLNKAFDDKKEYFTHWKDLFTNFIGEVAKYVKYEPLSMIEFLEDIINNHNDQVYYFADGIDNEFSFEILDRYKITGSLTNDSMDNILITDIELQDKYEENTILELHWGIYNGLLDIGGMEDDEIEGAYANLLKSFTLDVISEYIIDILRTTKHRYTNH